VLNTIPLGLSLPLCLSPLSLTYQVLPSPTDPMSDETPETPPVGPRHIGQADEPRELLNVIDQVHSTGWVPLEVSLGILIDDSLASVLMWMSPQSVFSEIRVLVNPRSLRPSLE